MERERLLLEALVQKRISRTGNVYAFRPTVGPPPASDRQIDRFLHDTNQRFDVSPILKGDQLQSRQVAADYFKFVVAEAKSAGLPVEKVIDRLKESMPHVKRSLATFYSYLDAQVKTKRHG